MTQSELHEAFEEANGEFLKFENIAETDRRHECPDLCAWIYLCEKLGVPRYGPRSGAPGKAKDVVGGAEHDEIMLAWERDDLERLTKDDVIYIHRCGVRYSEQYDSLCMFV
jgi:hypothetical protein